MSLQYIYWFAYYDEQEPSVRYRAKYVLETLSHQYGIEYVIVYPGYSFKKIIHFLTIYCSVLFFRKHNSLLVFQKIRTRRLYALLLAILLFFRRSNTLYDIDDADYLKFAPQTILHFMRHCPVCTVGSQALRTYAKAYSRNVVLLTSPVIDHAIIKTTRNNTFTVGWIGYYNAHRQNLIELLFPALQRIEFNLHLVLMGVTKQEHLQEINTLFAAHKHITIEMPQNINWTNETAVYEKIKTFDLGIAPLLDTEQNRAKSAFKLKQYLSCGIPALASNIGENNTFLQEGRNGYFCNTVEEYYNAIGTIKALDNTSYKNMSEHARLSAGAFSINNFCIQLIDLYNYTSPVKDLATT